MTTAPTTAMKGQSRKRLHSLCDDQAEYQQSKRALYKSLGHLTIVSGGADGNLDQKNQPPQELSSGTECGLGLINVGEKRSHNFDEDDSDTASNNGEVSCEMDNVSVNSDESYETKPMTRKKQFLNPMLPAEDNADIAQLLATGRKKYQRRIDYLVDEVIRKSKRTLHQPTGGEAEVSIPSSVGPQPTTDQALLTSYNSNWALQLYSSQQEHLGNNTLTASLSGENTPESYLDESDSSVDGVAKPKSINDNPMDVTEISEIMQSSSAGDEQAMDEAAVGEQELVPSISSLENSVIHRTVTGKVRHDGELSDLLVSLVQPGGLKTPLVEKAHLAGDCTHTEWGIEELHR